jgi:two-component system response regulator AtoC
MERAERMAIDLVTRVQCSVRRGYMVEVVASTPDDTLIGDSPAIHRVNDQLRKAALTEFPVLIIGESGTGKDLAVRLLHNASARKADSLLKVSCSTMSDQILDNKFFSRSNDSFNEEADSSNRGCGRAHRGTLFLDEIDELSPALQPKLLSALQDSHIVKLGSTDERLKDTRLICAATRNLEADVAKGEFRTDLFYRINVVSIEMPPLRERASDIPILMDHFIKMYTVRFGRNSPPLTSTFLRLLMSYHWPGNIRELENIAKRYVVMGGEEHVLSGIRPPEEFRPMWSDAIDLTTPLRVQTKRALQHLERKIILGVLEAHKWNRRKTARSLDISYRALLYKIKEVDLPISSSANLALSKSLFETLGELPGINKYPN